MRLKFLVGGSILCAVLLCRGGVGGGKKENKSPTTHIGMPFSSWTLCMTSLNSNFHFFQTSDILAAAVVQNIRPFFYTWPALITSSDITNGGKKPAKGKRNRVHLERDTNFNSATNSRGSQGGGGREINIGDRCTGGKKGTPLGSVFREKSSYCYRLLTIHI